VVCKYWLIKKVYSRPIGLHPFTYTLGDVKKCSYNNTLAMGWKTPLFTVNSMFITCVSKTIYRGCNCLGWHDRCLINSKSSPLGLTLKCCVFSSNIHPWIFSNFLLSYSWTRFCVATQSWGCAKRRSVVWIGIKIPTSLLRTWFFPRTISPQHAFQCHQ